MVGLGARAIRSPRPARWEDGEEAGGEAGGEAPQPERQRASQALFPVTRFSPTARSPLWN